MMGTKLAGALAMVAAWAVVAAGAPAAVRAQAQAEGPPRAVARAPQEAPRVSNVFVETFITQALQDIALQAGVNILVDSTVQGFVTLELQDVPLEKALAMVLAPGGFTYVKLDERTYLVGKPDRSSPIFHVLTATRRVKLGYVSADQARRLLSEYYNPYVRFDPETNTAVITASPDLVERIAADIAAIDRPAPQVEIQAVVTQLSEEARRQLGLEWDWSWDPAGSGGTEYRAGFDPVQGILSATVATPYHAILANLRKLIDSGQASIRANPRLTVMDGQSADIFVGEDRYFKIVTGSEAAPFTRLEAINVGVSLRITPRIASNGDVTLQVKPTVTDVTGQVGSDELPVVSRREVSTTVRVKAGETLVLGGLVQESEQHVTSKVPVLGDLPVLRYLFAMSRDQRIKSEVVVFITPRLVQPGQPAAP